MPVLIRNFGLKSAGRDLDRVTGSGQVSSTGIGRMSRLGLETLRDGHVGAAHPDAAGAALIVIAAHD
jgi:hypothetical protein